MTGAACSPWLALRQAVTGVRAREGRVVLEQLEEDHAKGVRVHRVMLYGSCRNTSGACGAAGRCVSRERPACSLAGPGPAWPPGCLQACAALCGGHLPCTRAHHVAVGARLARQLEGVVQLESGVLAPLGRDLDRLKSASLAQCADVVDQQGALHSTGCAACCLLQALAEARRLGPA